MKKHNGSARKGFTIIEVLIVLAIAGLILVIVLLAASMLSRNSRNLHRKEAVNYVAAEMASYYGLNGVYPDMGTVGSDKRAQFVSGITARSPVVGLSVDYTENSFPHNQVYQVGLDEAQSTVYITPGHNCQRDPSHQNPLDPDFPIVTAGFSDANYHFYAIYIVLEPNNTIYCIDNQN